MCAASAGGTTTDGIYTYKGFLPSGIRRTEDSSATTNISAQTLSRTLVFEFVGEQCFGNMRVAERHTSGP